MMIGRLHFPYHQRLTEAVLREDGRWDCPELPVLNRVLDTLYSPGRDGIPANHPRAIHQLHAAARWLKGTVEPRDGASSRN